MAHDERRSKLIANILAGKSKTQAALDAGYSESFSKVNVFNVVKSAQFQAELEQARSTSRLASQSPSAIARQTAVQEPETQQNTVADAADELTPKELRFLHYFLGEAAFNATKAARMAGYAGDDNVLGQTGFQLKRKPK